MRQPDYSGQFKRDVKQAQKGGWRGLRDAHIEPDWLLIYKVMGDVVRFERTGRHTDLFDE